MKRKSSLWSGISVLIVTTLVIMAFFRGNTEKVLLSTAYGIFAVWAIVRFLFPYLKILKVRFSAVLRKKHTAQSAQDNSENMDLIYSVLLQHVNYRITAYLQSAFPEATWEWNEKNPEFAITHGGTCRIKLFGVPDFNYAAVFFTPSADISCEFMKIVPIAQLHKSSDETEEIPHKVNPVNPQIWYEQQGKLILTDLINDLNSRGHHSLTIHDDGTVAIKQADKEITRQAFKSIPAKTYWPRLVNVFEREGIAADIKENGIILSW